MLRMLVLFTLIAAPASAETVVAKRIIRAQSTVSAEDIELRSGTAEGAISDLSAAIGLEARETIYQGQTLRPQDLGPAAIVDRNQRITLYYRSGPLSISTEGRALSRGGIGDQIRVLNVSSKTAVTALIDPRGNAVVDPSLR